MPFRPRLLVALSLALVCVGSIAGQRNLSAPKLVLVLAIDQMRFDYLTRFGPLYKGGLRTLLDHGAVFSNANYRHSVTETGPGHSVMLSGAHPSHSGIVGNDWYDPFLRKVVNVVEDSTQRPVGGSGRSASPLNALTFTVGDMLKRRASETRVVGVALKDRSAILLGGRRADAAYWYEAAGGNFITSSYYMGDPPQWLTRWNSQRLPDQYAGKPWDRLLPDIRLYDEYAGKDAVEGEWDRKDVVFPHAIRGKPPETLYYDDLQRTPAADELTLSFALEAMKAHRLGDDDVTDIFAIGFSGTDYIGHTYGADSHEILDQLLRLDQILGRLFEEVAVHVGLADTLVVLTADHGSLPLVENLQAKGIDAKRVMPTTIEDAVEQALQKRFPGASDLIAHFEVEVMGVYVDEAAIARHKLDAKEVERTIRAALMSTGVVDRVYSREDLLDTPPASDPWRQLFKNAFFQPRSPHLSVLVKKYTYVASYAGGTGHGTAHDYDRHVPIVFMGAGIRPGTYAQASGPEDIAPTLAQILKLEFPREADARVLTEILSPAP
jgi:predicted AlkP superfamily pyrophosphatase or phosphodiesterase